MAASKRAPGLVVGESWVQTGSEELARAALAPVPHLSEQYSEHRHHDSGGPGLNWSMGSADRCPTLDHDHRETPH